jgi:hypothetical protein
VSLRFVVLEGMMSATRGRTRMTYLTVAHGSSRRIICRPRKQIVSVSYPNIHLTAWQGRQTA